MREGCYGAQRKRPFSVSEKSQVLPGSSCETFPSSDGTYDVGNIKFEEDIDVEEEENLKGKAENCRGTVKEECIDIKDEEGIHSEEEEEDMDVDEEKDINIKEEVSFEDTV